MGYEKSHYHQKSSDFFFLFFFAVFAVFTVALGTDVISFSFINPERRQIAPNFIWALLGKDDS